MRVPGRVLDRIIEDIFVGFEKAGLVEYGEDREACMEVIRAPILADMLREEELDAEVEQVIEENREKFREVPAYQMYGRIKRQLAKERGIIL